MERPKLPSGAPANEGRRGLIRSALAFAMLPTVLGKGELEGEQVPIDRLDDVPAEELAETLQPRLESVNFERWKKGYQAWWVMPYDSVVFVDTKNEPVAPPFPFQEFTIDRERVRNGKAVIEPYLLTPGKFTEDGFLEANLAGEWLRHVRQLVAEEQEIAPDELKVVHVTEEFEKAIHTKDEPQLVEQIRSGEINRLTDIVYYYGDKPVVGAEEYSRIEYIQAKFSCHELGITPNMLQELQVLVPSTLCKRISDP
jgi:hypothetical protein